MRRAIRWVLISILATGCSCAVYAGKVQVVQLIKSTTSWNGHPLPAYPTGKPEITILRITIPPGATVPMHKHPVINAGVLLRGQLTVTTEAGDVLHLKANHPIIEVVNTWHYGKNEGKTPAELIMFYAGAVGMPLSIKKPVAPR